MSKTVFCTHTHCFKKHY